MDLEQLSGLSDAVEIFVVVGVQLNLRQLLGLSKAIGEVPKVVGERLDP